MQSIRHRIGGRGERGYEIGREENSPETRVNHHDMLLRTSEKRFPESMGKLDIMDDE